MIYLLFYFKNILKIGFFGDFKILRYSLFILALSGVIISLLQPDFFNMYVLGFQAGLINAYVSFRIIQLHKSGGGMSRVHS